MPATTVRNDENADANIQLEQAVGKIAGGRKPLQSGRAATECSPRGRQPKATKHLEPSLQAWAASRRGAAPCALARNIGASESAATPEAGAELSVESRFSRLSQRGTTKPQMSSEEREELRLQEKRRELQELMRQNEKSCREAIERPESAGTATARSMELTVPQEFNLSTPRSSLGSNVEALERGGSERVDWEHSLRRPVSAQEWKPQLTVPKGPMLQTELRPRSCSRAPSRSCSPAATPERRHHSTPRRGLPARELTAIEQHTGRLTTARMWSASPLRRRLEAPSPARSVRSARGRSVPAPSPARSTSADSDISCGSRFSRLSELSRPRSLSRPHPTSEELELREAQRGRRALREQMRQNERSLCEALVPEPTLGSVNSRVSRLPLTVPMAPSLETECRARSRSASRHREGSAAPEMRNMASHAIPAREQGAIERHFELASLAHAQPSSTLPLSQPPPRLLASTTCPPGADHERWVRAGSTAEDRAQRARVVAQAQRAEAEASAKMRLCIFRPREVAAGEPAGQAPETCHGSDGKAVAATAEDQAQQARAKAEAKREEALATERARLCIFKAPRPRAPGGDEEATPQAAERKAPGAVAHERVVVRRSTGAAPAPAPCAEEPCVEPCPAANQEDQCDYWEPCKRA